MAQKNLEAETLTKAFCNQMNKARKKINMPASRKKTYPTRAIKRSHPKTA